MADILEYRTYTNTPSGSFVSTTTLNDHAAGDTTTNASGNNPSSVGDIQDSPGVAKTIYVEARYTLDIAAILTAVQFTVLPERNGTPNGTVASWQLYTGDASEVYTLQASGTNTFNSFSTNFWSGSVASVKFVKAIFSINRPSIGAPQISASITDIRLTTGTAVIDVPLSASVTINITGGTQPSLNARTTVTVSATAAFVAWIRDCAGPVVDWGRSCAGAAQDWSKTSTEAATAWTRGCAGAARTWTKGCVGAVTAWTKRGTNGD